MKRLAAGAPPAVARQLDERPGGRAFHHHRHVVPRAVTRAAGALAPVVALAMVARIPAPVGHVDAAAHRQLVVDHDDLLMMAAADRVDAVELEVDPLVRQPAQQIEHHRSTRGDL